MERCHFAYKPPFSDLIFRCDKEIDYPLHQVHHHPDAGFWLHEDSTNHVMDLYAPHFGGPPQTVANEDLPTE